MEGKAYKRATGDEVGQIERWLKCTLKKARYPLFQARFETRGEITMSFRCFVLPERHGPDGDSWSCVNLYRVAAPEFRLFSVLYELPERNSVRQLIEQCFHQYSFSLGEPPESLDFAEREPIPFCQFLTSLVRPGNFSEYHFRHGTF